MAGAIAQHRRNCEFLFVLMKNLLFYRVTRPESSGKGAKGSLLHRLRERDRGFLGKRDVEVDLLLLQRFNDQSCGFGIHRFSLHREKKAPPLHRARPRQSAQT